MKRSDKGKTTLTAATITEVRGATKTDSTFMRLCKLQADHPYWKNEWMFTKDVFRNESLQCRDSNMFWAWANNCPTDLRRYIDKAP